MHTDIITYIVSILTIHVRMYASKLCLLPQDPHIYIFFVITPLCMGTPPLAHAKLSEAMCAFMFKFVLVGTVSLSESSINLYSLTLNDI